MAARSVRRGPLGAVFGAAAWLAALGILLMVPAINFAADEPKAAAARLSNQAFALLGSIGAGSDASKSLLGPVAGFAGDAQSLSSALGSGNHSAAAQAMAELQSDREAVDAAAKAHPGVLDGAKWESLKHQLDALAKAVPPSAVPSAASAAGIEERGGAGPKVKIESLGVDADQITHVKGFLEGRDLKSAGVYSGAREVRAFEIGPAKGSLRINFDIQLGELEPGTVIRVYDKSGRSAEAQVTPTESAEPTGSAESREPSAVIVSRGSESAAPEEETSEVGGSNTAEIPSTGPPSPSKRHIQSHLGGLADVRIQIDNTILVDPLLREYQIVGRISGNRVERAAIFVDGRMAQEIPLAGADGFGRRGFNQTFVMNGIQATIRVYAAGDQYVENSIRTPAAVVPGPVMIPGYGVNPYTYGARPYGVPPYGYGVNPYGATNPYARPINPYGTANPGYSGYNMNPNGNVAPGYNPYGYPYQNYPPPTTKWWQQLLP